MFILLLPIVSSMLVDETGRTGGVPAVLRVVAGFLLGGLINPSISAYNALRGRVVRTTAATGSRSNGR
jgi:hypothetical protein